MRIELDRGVLTLTNEDAPINRMTFEYMDEVEAAIVDACLLYTSPSPRDLSTSRMPSSA